MLVMAPPVVAVPVWTVRGRPIDRPGALLAGNPRCCCVRVCQCPVLTGGSGRRRAYPSQVMPLQEVAAGESAA